MQAKFWETCLELAFEVTISALYSQQKLQVYKLFQFRSHLNKMERHNTQQQCNSEITCIMAWRPSCMYLKIKVCYINYLDYWYIEKYKKFSEFTSFG